MKEIKLTQGKVALVDDADFERLNKFKWCARKDHNTYYAVRRDRKKKNGNIQMHREILGIINKEVLIDHRDHNGLNNQRNNLRTATTSGNNKNRTSLKGATSKYLGVCFYHRTGRWKAQIRLKNGKVKHLGYYIYEETAALKYNEVAEKEHGEFANLNKISEF